MSAAVNAIPRSEAELTDAWLSGLLGSPVHITGREGVGVGSAFACRLFRLTLTGPAGAPASVIAKMPVDGEVRAMLDGIGAYTREVVFYRDLADQVPVRTPIAYSAEQANDSTDFVIVMEDLVDCTPVDQIAGMTFSQAESAVDALARMHAWSWERTELLDEYADRFWPIGSDAGTALQTRYGQLFAHVWGMRREAFAELLSLVAQDVGDRYAELQPRLVSALATPRCITHGELRADNLFFADGDEPVFFDFQAIQQECGVRELAYLIGTSMPEELLAEHEDTLLSRYVEGLANGGAAYTLERAREQYADSATYNLLWPVMASIRWEASSQRGRDTLDIMVRRLGAAIDRTRG